MLSTCKNQRICWDQLRIWKNGRKVRFPICMESPHNAVVLKCSSYEMGCRPYMCNTSYRHSNCLDQFCKSVTPHLPAAILQEIPLTSVTSHRSRWESQMQAKLICPLCRGQIYGYMVLEPARRYMNSKPRSCSCETCEFQVTYSELREHARSEHPSVRPWEVDPSRQRDWIRMEQETDHEDVLSSIHSDPGAEYSREDLVDFLDESIFYIDEFDEMNPWLQP